MDPHRGRTGWCNEVSRRSTWFMRAKHSVRRWQTRHTALRLIRHVSLHLSSAESRVDAGDSWPAFIAGGATLGRYDVGGRAWNVNNINAWNSMSSLPEFQCFFLRVRKMQFMCHSCLACFRVRRIVLRLALWERRVGQKEKETNRPSCQK